MKIELTIGVTPLSGSVTSANDAALKAAALAEASAEAGTFGVGGLLVTRRGRILAQAVNSVIRGGVVADPTAHVERQLVDWYFQERTPRALPPVEEVVIVSSLDPCAMCAGAILKSGLSAIAVAEDSVSGVHNHQGLPHRMPRELWARAEKFLAMFTVQGRRGDSCTGLNGPLAGAVSQEAFLRCQTALQESIMRVRSRIGGTPADLRPTLPFAEMMGHLRSLQIDLPQGVLLAASELLYLSLLRSATPRSEIGRPPDLR